MCTALYVFVCARLCASESFTPKGLDGQDRGSGGRMRAKHQGVNANSLLAKTSTASHLFRILF